VLRRCQLALSKQARLSLKFILLAQLCLFKF
jgi:hypothetical protein